MSADPKRGTCEDAPCCGCCPEELSTEPSEDLREEELEDEDVEHDAELGRDRILEEQEHEDFARDDVPELSIDADELQPWGSADWVSD